MKKNNLSKEIEEGIKNGFWKPICYILITILLVFVVVLFINSLKPEDYSTQNLNCNSLINCKIIDTTEVYGGVDCSTNYTDVLGNDICDNLEYYYPTIYEEELCGWEESYFWFKNIKDNFRGDKNKLFMECE